MEIEIGIKPGKGRRSVWCSRRLLCKRKDRLSEQNMTRCIILLRFGIITEVVFGICWIIEKHTLLILVEVYGNYMGEVEGSIDSQK